MTRGASVLWALCLCACDGAKPQLSAAPGYAPSAAKAEPADQAPAGETSETSDALPSSVEPPQPAAAAERALRFRVVSGQPPASAIEGLGELIAVGAQSTVLDLEDGTRVTAAPNSQLFALGFAKSLLLVTGQLHVLRLPDAARAQVTPARIASFGGALEPSVGADLALRVEVQTGPKQAAAIAQRAQLGLLRGTVFWFGSNERGAPEQLELSAPGPLPKPPDGMQWWSSAAHAKPIQALRRVAVRSEELERALEAALLEQHALRERGHVLLARVSPRHAALAKAPAPESDEENSTREYQRALVKHARLQNAQASQLLLAAERSLLAALAACGPSANSACASLQAWSERFAARVSGLL